MRRTEAAEAAIAGRRETGEMRSRSAVERWQRRLRLAVSAEQRGAEKYRILDLKRRRAQIRARRELRLL
jgi:hypothetical protein